MLLLRELFGEESDRAERIASILGMSKEELLHKIEVIGIAASMIYGMWKAYSSRKELMKLLK